MLAAVDQLGWGEAGPAAVETADRVATEELGVPPATLDAALKTYRNVRAVRPYRQVEGRGGAVVTASIDKTARVWSSAGEGEGVTLAPGKAVANS